MANLKWTSTSNNPCPSCVALHGQVHTREQWEEFGIEPRHHRLYCKDACSCTLNETSESETGDLGAVPLRQEENAALFHGSAAPRSARRSYESGSAAKGKPMKKTMPILRSMPIADRLQLPPRAELLPQIESGALDHIEFTANVFKQGGNRNHYKFRDEDLSGFAASFEGQPFLRNHDTYDIDARDGTIVESRLEGGAFVQRIRLTTRRGMLDFVEGKIDRFSIGWFYSDVLCSICNSTWFSITCPHAPGRTYNTDNGKKTCELIFQDPKGKETSAVNTPAVEGTGIEGLQEYKLEVIGGGVRRDPRAPRVHPKSKKGHNLMDPEDTTTESAVTEQQRAALELQGANEIIQDLQAKQRQATELQIAQCRALLDTSLAASKLPAASQKAVRKPFELMLDSGKPFLPTELQTAITEKREELAALNETAIQGPARAGGFSGMFNGTDQVKAALADLLGAERDEGLEKLRVRPLTGIREAYTLMTGDISFMGGYHPEYALVSANFPGIVADLLNKVLVRAWEDFRGVYGWWERIVTVEHFTNLQDVKWLKTGTIASLPEVAERGEYTELPIGDNKESSDFDKYGGYIPLTLEAMMNDDVRALRRMPREAALAGIRNISEQVAAIFTSNSAAGPTLADGGALFNATAVTTAGGHANLLTTALGTDFTAWDAVAAAVYNQPLLVKNETGKYGTGKKQAIEPSIFLGPRALKAAAEALFIPRWAGTVAEAIAAKGGPTYGGYVTPLTVPEWTDANDWAAVVDPKLVPGVMIGEVFGLKPQIFSASSEIDPAMFSNDEARIKVRQFLNVGVADFRPLHKSNVT